jgi:hypothetical protein
MTFVFAAGDIGIEYNFDIPLLISLDFRPEIGDGYYKNNYGSDVALASDTSLIKHKLQKHTLK